MREREGERGGVPQRSHSLAHADLPLRHPANQEPAEERVSVNEGHLGANEWSDKNRPVITGEGRNEGMRGGRRGEEGEGASAQLVWDSIIALHAATRYVYQVGTGKIGMSGFEALFMQRQRGV